MGSAAVAQAVVWTKQYPDLLPATGAAEYSVAIARTADHVYVGGMAYRQGVSQFCLAKHDFATGAILVERNWPPTTHGDPDIRTVTGMTSFQGGTSDAGYFWLVGHQPDYYGAQRVAVVQFESPGAPSTALNIGWSRQEDVGGEPADEYAVGIASSVNNVVPFPTPRHLAVAVNAVDTATGKSGVQVLAYVAVNGKNMWRGKWKSTPTSNDRAVSVAIVKDAIIVAGTTDRVTGSTQTYDRVFVIALEAETGEHLSGSPQIYDAGVSGTPHDLIAVAAATAAEELGNNMTAIATTRTDSDTGRITVGVQTCSIEDAPRQLQSGWSEGWTGLEDPNELTPINQSTSVEVAYFRPVGDINTSPHVWLTGTVQTAGGAPKGALTLQFANAPDPLTGLHREWWAKWRQDATGDNVPSQVRFSQNAPNAPRVYVTGKTQVGLNPVDMVTLKYSGARVSLGGERISEWGQAGNPIWNSTTGADDRSLTVLPAPGMRGEGISFFITGPSYSGGTADDWGTIRYSDN